jgi:hypothetical protein
MGPTMLFHLGAGEGGLTSFTERYTDSFNRWFDDLGELHLDPEVAAQLVAGIAEATGEQTTAELSAGVMRSSLRSCRQPLALQRCHARDTRRAAEDFVEHRAEVLEIHDWIVRVEAVLVVLVTEVDATVVVRRVFVHLSGIAVAVVMMEVVVALKETVVLDDPVRFLVDIWAKERSGSVAVVLGGEAVGDIVKQRSDDHVDGFVVAIGPGSGLQRVRIAVSLIAELRALQQAEQHHQVVDERFASVLVEGGTEVLVVLPGAVLHLGPGDHEFVVVVRGLGHARSIRPPRATVAPHG